MAAGEAAWRPPGRVSPARASSPAARASVEKRSARIFRQRGAHLLCYIIRVIVAAQDAHANRRRTHPVNPLPTKRIPA